MELGLLAILSSEKSFATDYKPFITEHVAIATLLIYNNKRPKQSNVKTDSIRDCLSFIFLKGLEIASLCESRHVLPSRVTQDKRPGHFLLGIADKGDIGTCIYFATAAGSGVCSCF